VLTQADVILHGITADMIQDIVQQAWHDNKVNKSRYLSIDFSYLYTFYVKDLPFVRKFTDSINQGSQWVPEGGRKVLRNPVAVEWHKYLETWFMGRYVNLYGRPVKPKQITRSCDRVPNEFLERIARSFAGQDFNTMVYHAIGDGANAGSNPSPNDTALDNEIARIHVILDSGGGALSVDGTTFYSVANFPKTLLHADLTESGIFDKQKPGTGATDVAAVDDVMGDHSIFPEKIEHEQGVDAPGSTIIIYSCAG